MVNERFKLADKTIEKTVRYFIKVNPYLLRYNDIWDLRQEVFTHFLEKKFFDKYDSTITSFQYFVARAAKNHLIDMTRKSIEKTVSLDASIGEGQEITLYDIVPSNLTDAYASVLFSQMISKCPSTRISRNYDLTWRGLLDLVIEGYTVSEMHVILGLSSGRVSQLVTELKAIMKFVMDGGRMENA